MSTQTEQTSIRTEISVEAPIGPSECSSKTSIASSRASTTCSASRVELEHRHLDRHGEGWPEARDGVGGEGGWPLYLQRYADLVAETR